MTQQTPPPSIATPPTPLSAGATVLVTGARGFLGHYVCDALTQAGLIPLRFDRRGPTDFLGDVRDAAAVDEAVARVDGVIHLAGVLGTQETLRTPETSVAINISGSLVVFEACARRGRPAVYITVGNHWMENPYSITKTCAERFAWMANAEWGTRITVVRALNAYGPGQAGFPVRKIIPTFVTAARAGLPIEIYGDGTQIMDMIHAAEVADVLVRALTVDHGQYTRPFEAGTGRRTTVSVIADVVAAVVGSAIPHRYLPMRPGEPAQAVVVGDPETLRPLYPRGLPAFRTLREGIAEVVRQEVCGG